MSADRQDRLCWRVGGPWHVHVNGNGLGGCGGHMSMPPPLAEVEGVGVVPGSVCTAISGGLCLQGLIHLHQ